MLTCFPCLLVPSFTCTVFLSPLTEPDHDPPESTLLEDLTLPDREEEILMKKKPLQEGRKS